MATETRVCYLCNKPLADWQTDSHEECEAATEVSYTSGPWVVGDQEGPSDESSIHADGISGPVICQVWPMGVDFDGSGDDGDAGESCPIRDANARLIAASPDLLEELDNVTACLETCMVHFGKQMTEADVRGRNARIAAARAIIAIVRG